jgi:hypothetical protein
MREPYSEDLASHAGPESCASVRKDRCEALTGGSAGELLSREIIDVRGADAVSVSGRQHALSRKGERQARHARSQNLSMHGHTSRENREIPWPPVRYGAAGRGGKSEDPSHQ